MNRKSVLAVFLSVATTAAMSAEAAEFGSQVEAVKVTGICQLLAEGSDTPESVVEGTMIPYGALIKTDDDSSLVLRFSEGNGFRLLAKSSIRMVEDPASSSTKIIDLSDEGAVRVILESTYRTDNVLKVKTPNAVVEAIACDFSVEHRLVGDLHTTFITDSEGSIAVSGEYYNMPGLGAGNQVTIAASEDGKFVRIKVVEGTVQTGAYDADGSMRTLTLNTGDELQILIEEIAEKPGKMLVAYKVNHADGSTPEVFQSEVGEQKTGAADAGKGTGGEDDRRLGAAAPQVTSWPLLTVQPPTVIMTHTPVGLR